MQRTAALQQSHYLWQGERLLIILHRIVNVVGVAVQQERRPVSALHHHKLLQLSCAIAVRRQQDVRGKALCARDNAAGRTQQTRKKHNCTSASTCATAMCGNNPLRMPCAGEHAEWAFRPQAQMTLSSSSSMAACLLPPQVLCCASLRYTASVPHINPDATALNPAMRLACVRQQECSEPHRRAQAGSRCRHLLLHRHAQ